MSVIINELNCSNLESKLTLLLEIMTEWFHSNMLSLNLEKNSCIKFSMKYDYTNKLNTEYRNKNLLLLNEVKFLGMTLDNIMSWKKHIESITKKLNKACYISRRSKTNSVGFSLQANYTD
jgi:hypothetical protein